MWWLRGSGPRGIHPLTLDEVMNHAEKLVSPLPSTPISWEIDFPAEDSDSSLDCPILCLNRASLHLQSTFHISIPKHPHCSPSTKTGLESLFSFKAGRNQATVDCKKAKSKRKVSNPGLLAFSPFLFPENLPPWVKAGSTPSNLECVAFGDSL